MAVYGEPAPVVTKKLKPPRCFEVRYEDEESAKRAVQDLDGSYLGEGMLRVTLNTRSLPVCKVNVQGIGYDVYPRIVREHFEQAGPVVFFKSMFDITYGEVRFKTADQAWKAKEEFDGSELLGKKLRVELDCTTDFMNKLLVHGLSPAVMWQELKDHFKQAGEVVFAAVHGGRTARAVYETKQAARRAMKVLNRSRLRGQKGALRVFAPWDSTAETAEVCVRNLPQDVDQKELFGHFSSIGKLKYVKITTERLPPEFCE